MTILVTGGCGFIGTNFISNWFQRTDEHVVNIDCMTYAANTFCLDNPPHINLTNLNVNITETERLVEVYHAYHPRAVIHFAAESHVDRSIASADQFIKTNINGTYALLINAQTILRLQTMISATNSGLSMSTDEVFVVCNLMKRGLLKQHPTSRIAPTALVKQRLITLCVAIMKLLACQHCNKLFQQLRSLSTCGKVYSNCFEQFFKRKKNSYTGRSAKLLAIC